MDRREHGVGIIREILVLTSAVERYLRAITANDEAGAARFTCRKTGGLLWVSSAGRPIAMLRVTGIDLESPEQPSARVVIQVGGEPESALILKKIDGEWCVWP